MLIYEPYKKVPLSDFVNELRFEFPNVPDDIFFHHIRKTANTAARQGSLIRRFALLHPESCVTRYRLESPDGEEICAILGIYEEDCCHGVRGVTRSYVPPEQGCLRACGRKVAWYDDVEEVLHIDPGHCGSQFRIALAVAPDMAACELPKSFFDRYFELLLTGAKSGIMLMSGRPWSNLRLGAEYYQMFKHMLRDAAVSVAKHKMQGAIKMNFGKGL